ncbi:MAG: hypothetical protein BWZ01_02422 [Deltaproteobacteria bacterium ADurb.BinA179]|jgi:hypothetical protein|nr:hypothetical protein [Pseudomonadota bacterium]OPZ25614.1 MAG: hypothetical protein BWZ01_02422 [Deltaproteobacteria bacterium ADurb.BinA179]HOD71987.1 hypothetical protein [Deltaproteobacteria bacterium]HPA85755.1 hypothetical protein [Deltaproteobacteria bacterium]HPV30395.1 hypothetical protein [Deltaproteobacteria bacterium]
MIEQLHANNPSQLYRFYLDRIESYRITPPPDDWNGVFTIQLK